MTWDYARVDAHQNGDCDTATCPLCELERADEEVPCEWCNEPMSEGEGDDNACMIPHCPDCIATCRHCQDDMKDEADL